MRAEDLVLHKRCWIVVAAVVVAVVSGVSAEASGKWWFISGGERGRRRLWQHTYP